MDATKTADSGVAKEEVDKKAQELSSQAFFLPVLKSSYKIQ